jgi:hypothetical protein
MEGFKSFNGKTDFADLRIFTDFGYNGKTDFADLRIFTDFGYNGKTDFADLRMETDFFYEKARVSRKNPPPKSVFIRKSAKSVLPLYPNGETFLP